MGRKIMPKHASNPDKLSVGELARLTGVNVETVRYYEHIGLLPTPPKTISGRRVFGNEHLSALSLIKRARDLGFGIKDIRELLALRHREELGYALVQSRELDQEAADLRREDRVLFP